MQETNKNRKRDSRTSGGIEVGDVATTWTAGILAEMFHPIPTGVLRARRKKGKKRTEKGNESLRKPKV